MILTERRSRVRWLPVVLLLAISSTLGGCTSRPAPATNIEVRANRILVDKQAHTLTLFRDGRPLKTYRVALGRGGPGQKLRGGDNKVPEGVYRIVGRNSHSAFHRALCVGYPTPE